MAEFESPNANGFEIANNTKYGIYNEGTKLLLRLMEEA